MKYKLYHVWSILQLGGDVKPLYFLNALRYEDYLSEYRSKILYLHLESLPQSFIKDGWLAEAYLRNYMSVNALNLIKGENFSYFFYILAIFDEILNFGDWQLYKKVARLVNCICAAMMSWVWRWVKLVVY